MGKYYGFIGYSETTETRPGVWTNVITEREVFGDIIFNNKKVENATQVNENITLNMQISFIADPYSLENFHLIKYAKYSGAKWKVLTVSDHQRPRLVLTLGGVYNDE